ncbi:MAG: hypothetical protein DPW18_09505 [Chloroflexi bacterium]|nr:hypothetical protein [Chloroflexota bacterium]MDL1941760.1 hypothetical protein [Chloroflexi bacterium CFX2]
MKKIQFFLLLVLLSVSCSLGQFVPAAPTATATLTNTVTFTPLPTATPVTPTLTFTPSPTLIGFKTATPTPSITDTPLASDTPTPPVTPDTATPTVQMKGFLFVTVSLPEFYKGTKCEPSKVKITAQVLDRDNVKYVLLFARFKSLTSQRTGKWTNIPMETIGAGTYLHDLSSDEILEDAFFQSAWVEFQIVATSQSGRELGRTDIFKEKLKMLECVPTPTPTSANVRP